MAKLIIVLLAVFVVALGGVMYMAGQKPGLDVLTGTVRYNERVALPAGSQLTVELREAVSPSAPPTPISRYDYTTGGENVPLPYTLSFDPSKIMKGNVYTLVAEISFDGMTRFSTQSPVTIFTAESPVTGTDILLVPSSESSTSAPEFAHSTSSNGSEGKKSPSLNPLNGTAWVWRETSYLDRVTEPRGDDFVIRFTENGVLSSTDCNSLGGTYIVADSNITFSPLEMTEMYCAGSQESEYVQALSQVLQFSISDTALTFNIGSGGEMRFERVENPEQTYEPTEEPIPPTDPDTPVSSDSVMLDAVEASVDAVQE